MSWLHMLMAAFLLLCSAIHFTDAAVDRTTTETYKLIYDEMLTFSSCFRRFNGTHEIGCTSGMNGNTGIIHYINDTASLEWLIANGTHQSYIPLIESDMFTGSAMRRLNNSEKIGGVMVIQTNTSDKSSYPQQYSPDNKCPNERSSIYSQDSQYSCDKHQYNPRGNGLAFTDLRVPMMLMTSQEEVDRMIKCYYDHNLPSNDKDGKPTFPLCSAELQAFMNGAGSTEICMRRNNIIRNFDPDSYCQIIGGHSSLAFLTAAKESATKYKTIAIVSRTDSLSLFEDMQPGTSSPVSALTVLLTVAETLNQNLTVKDEIKGKGYNVLFLALAGEAFDYIGSQKLVYDMQQGFFPNSSYDDARVKLSDIDILVELSQLIDGFPTNTLYTHVDPKTQASHQTEITKFIDALKSEAPSSLTFTESASTLPLPPASAQMFLREDVGGLPVVVLADYDDTFKALYYNSYLDTPEAHDFYFNRSAVDYDVVTPQAQFLAEVATTISKAVYRYATDTSVDISASESTANQLLYCLLITRQCDLFYGTIDTNHTDVLDSSPTPFPMYVSVYDLTRFNQLLQYMVKHLLAYYTGSKLNDVDWKTCTDEHNGVYIDGVTNNGTRTAVCVLSTAQYHNASSPAFEIENYDFTTTKYSTWTESVWSSNAFRVRIFLKPSPEVELASMVAGITIFIATAIAVVLLQKRASVLFPPHTDNRPLLSQNVAPT